MATSLSLPNFISFFFPPKSPPSPKLAPTQVPTPPPHHPPSQSSPQQFQSLSLNSRDDLSSVICPSLAYSNTLYAKDNYNVQLVVEEDEPEDLILSLFRREVIRAGVFQEVRRRMFHEDRQEEKKRRIKEAQRRNRSRRPFVRQDEEFVDKPLDDDEDDDDDDNWDMPEGEDYME